MLHWEWVAGVSALEMGLLFSHMCRILCWPLVATWCWGSEPDTALPGNCHQLAGTWHPRCLQWTIFQFLWQAKSILFSNCAVWWQLSTKPSLASPAHPWPFQCAPSLKSQKIVWWLSPHPWSIIRTAVTTPEQWLPFIGHLLCMVLKTYCLVSSQRQCMVG